MKKEKKKYDATITIDVSASTKKALTSYIKDVKDFATSDAEGVNRTFCYYDVVGDQ